MLFHCRSELAREKPKGARFIQAARVIVDDLREQARSYSEAPYSFGLGTTFRVLKALQRNDIATTLFFARHARL